MKYIILLLVVFTSSLVAAAELPSPVQRDINSYERAVERAQEAFDAAVEEAQQDLIDDLEAQLERYTRRGDLDTALAIRQVVERVRGGNAASTGQINADAPPQSGEINQIADLGLLQVGAVNRLADPMRAGQAFVINKDGLGRELIQQLPAHPGILRTHLASGNHQLPGLIGARGQYVALVSRDYGGARENGDYVDNVTFTLNGHRFTIPRWNANTIIFLPVAGGVVREYTMNLGATSWGPELESVLLVQ